MEHVNLIVAFSKNYIIGKNQSIPWNIPGDLKWFKNQTKGSILIMGRKTFESLPNGPLPNRHHIVLTNNSKAKEKQVEYMNLGKLVLFLENTQTKCFVIGGEEIYTLLFPYCKYLYITKIQESVKGDTCFPYTLSEIEKNYEKTEESEIQCENNWNYQFLIYKKA